MGKFETNQLAMLWANCTKQKREKKNKNNRTQNTKLTNIFDNSKASKILKNA